MGIWVIFTLWQRLGLEGALIQQAFTEHWNTRELMPTASGKKIIITMEILTAKEEGASRVALETNGKEKNAIKRCWSD